MYAPPPFSNACGRHCARFRRAPLSATHRSLNASARRNPRAQWLRLAQPITSPSPSPATVWCAATASFRAIAGVSNASANCCSAKHAHEPGRRAPDMNVHGGFIDRLNCTDIATQLDQEGYAVLRGLLNDSQVRELAALRGVASADDRVSPASEQPGRGNLFYFLRPLPAPLEELRTAFYGCLAPIANRWRGALDIPHRYPDTLDAFLMQNRKAGQVCAQSNITHLLADGYQVLHQHSDGEQVFPLQLVSLLSEPEKDFTGGEFVMTEQRPRMQSRPMVLPLRRGDVAVIAVAERPFKGSKGYYRVNLKHAISRVRSGERVGLELMFHDAKRS